MLSATCPSCGAPIRFAHAVAVSAICERCRSTVVRHDEDLELAGHASVFPRDLSPIVLGSVGKVGGRGFVIAGVMRKARERARWNEWFLVFDDGKSGWLGEGNGQFQVYDAWREFPADSVSSLTAGSQIRIGGAPWQVIEADTARVVAADGELPFAATDDSPSAYADLRLGDGKTCATLDADFDPPRLYTGRVVELKELNLDRIQPFTGWSDPDLQAAMKGPEVKGAKSLACPACNAPLTLRSPDAISIACSYCGTVTALTDAMPERALSKFGPAKDWKPTIELGKRGKLDAIEWEVIGAMDRYVAFEGRKYRWTEHFLFNPYHGYRWLAEDHGTRHWNFIERLPDLPRRPTSTRAVHAGHTYRAFQAGGAQVERVIGEFTWEVRAGDLAETIDFVDPPWMLSIETEFNEQSASIGRWLPADEVASAFGVADVYRPVGVAPNQPNPFDQRGTISMFAVGTIAFSLAAVGLFVGQLLWSANQELVDWDAQFSGDDSRLTEVSPAFVVEPGLRRNLAVELSSTLSSQTAIVHLTLLNQDDGNAYHVNAGRTSGTGRVNSVSAGRYVIVAEGNAATPGVLSGHRVSVDVIRDRPNFLPVLLAFLVVLVGPIWWFAGRTAFEGRRWAASDFR
jgi:hypothetical protein